MLSKWKGSYDGKRKYHKEWEREFPWLKNRENLCYCKWCMCFLKGIRKSMLENHSKTLKHRKRCETLGKKEGSIGDLQNNKSIEGVLENESIKERVNMKEENTEMVPEFDTLQSQKEVPMEMAVNTKRELPDFLHNYVVFQLNDYINYRPRKQYWKEPFVLRIIEAVWKKEMKSKKAAEILGISASTMNSHCKKKKDSWIHEALVSEIEVDFENETTTFAPATIPQTPPTISSENRGGINNEAKIRIIYGGSLDTNEEHERPLTIDESRHDDEHDALGKIVAMKLRNATSQQRFLAERIIHEVLFQVQMETLNDNFSFRLPYFLPDNND